MQLIDPTHPFYRPLWRRLVIVGAVAVWFLFELLVAGGQLWLIITGSLLAYTLWTLVLSWKGKDEAKS